uniref:Putative BTB_POZ domain-containing protein n=1 Tax=Moumouvirus sp. 'Monve' TaxID=1128131 RepID=H2ED65_9VIRU|nr:putative BTB_POZ domain-containing protein [Moumouvirus Monve]
MNFSNVFDTEILSDMELTLLDKNNIKKSLNLHKIILYTKSPFFEKMFNNFKEKYELKITLEVPNVEVFIDILKSFYGIQKPDNNNWKYQLTNYICRQYLLLVNKLPNKLIVPKKDFEEFLEITQAIEYTDGLINLIADNLPFDFDLDKLSIELIKEIENKYVNFQILTISHGGIYIIDINYRESKNIISGDFYDFAYLQNINKILAMKRHEKNMLMYDLKTNKIVKQKNSQNILKTLKILIIV